MMMQTPEHNSLALLFTENHLSALFEALDDLHSAASEGELHTVTTMSQRELVAWLNECIYTAQETVAEIKRQQKRTEPKLRVLPKPKATPRGA